MSYLSVEDLQKKTYPQVAASQACRLLEVSRSGCYANAATLGHPSGVRCQRPPEGGLCSQPQGVWQPQTDNGDGRARLGNGSAACAALSQGAVSVALASQQTALRLLAKRWTAPYEELRELDAQLARLTKKAAPRLLARLGVGPQTATTLLVTAGDNPTRLHSEAALAALCGTSSLQASSGKTQRHRLNRGGDRQANNAL